MNLLNFLIIKWTIVCDNPWNAIYYHQVTALEVYETWVICSFQLLICNFSQWHYLFYVFYDLTVTEFCLGSSVLPHEGFDLVSHPVHRYQWSICCSWEAVDINWGKDFGKCFLESIGCVEKSSPSTILDLNMLTHGFCFCKRNIFYWFFGQFIILKWTEILFWLNLNLIFFNISLWIRLFMLRKLVLYKRFF